jgi:hypothetical protein
MVYCNCAIAHGTLVVRWSDLKNDLTVFPPFLLSVCFSARLKLKSGVHFSKR